MRNSQTWIALAVAAAASLAACGGSAGAAKSVPIVTAMPVAISISIVHAQPTGGGVFRLIIERRPTPNSPTTLRLDLAEKTIKANPSSPAGVGVVTSRAVRLQRTKGGSYVATIRFAKRQLSRTLIVHAKPAASRRSFRSCISAEISHASSPSFESTGRTDEAICIHASAAVPSYPSLAVVLTGPSHRRKSGRVAYLIHVSNTGQKEETNLVIGIGQANPETHESMAVGTDCPQMPNQDATQAIRLPPLGAKASVNCRVWITAPKGLGRKAFPFTIGLGQKGEQDFTLLAGIEAPI